MRGRRVGVARKMAIAAGGTHPTEMHSSRNYLTQKQKFFKYILPNSLNTSQFWIQFGII